MSFERRSYQDRAVKYTYETECQVLLAVAPGGSGKSVMMAKAVKLAVRDNEKVLLISHRWKINEQLIKALQEVGVHPSIIQGSETSDQQNDVIVASIDTLNRRGLYPEVNRVHIDEAHRGTAAIYRKLIDHYREAGTKITGWTATPYRMNGAGLCDVFDEMYEVVKPSALLGKYIMRPLLISAAPEYLPDLRGVSRSCGDFTPSELVTRVNKAGLIGGIVATVKKHLKDMQALVFCVSVEHSKKTTERLQMAGYRCAHMDGNMPMWKRDEIFQKYRDGLIQIICSCMLLNEGIDLPNCDMVILARPTASLSLYIQQVNRCVRINESGRQPKVIDHAINVLIHKYYLPWYDRSWSLDGIDEEPSVEHLPTPRICPECGTWNEPNAKECENDECQEDLTTHRTRILTPTEREYMELVEWTKNEKARRLGKIEAYAKQNGESSKWVEETYKMWVVDPG